MDKDILAFKETCLKRWTQSTKLDKRLNAFNDNFIQWFGQIPEKYKEIVLVLLRHLEYFPRKKVNEYLEELHTRLLDNKNVTDENTVYAFIKSEDGKTNSSNDYWTEYKRINELNKNICFENLDAITCEQWPYIDNIVFIDDFSGSGGSLIKELKKKIDIYKGKNIYLITIGMMKQGKAELERFAEEKDINIFFLTICSYRKAFESHFFDKDDDARSKIYAMSKSFIIPSNNILGFKDSQSLIAFHNNTPNNTLGFIWNDTDQYNSLFPRRNDPKPNWQNMKKDKRNRKATNYYNRKGY